MIYSMYKDYGRLINLTNSLTLNLGSNVNLNYLKICGIEGETSGGPNSNYYHYFYNCTSSAYINNSLAYGLLEGSEFIYYHYRYLWMHNCTANMGVSDQNKVGSFYDFYKERYYSSYTECYY